MTIEERVQQLESTVGTLGLVAEIGAHRINWLIDRAAENAGYDDFIVLEHSELVSLIKLADTGQPAEAAAAQRALETMGLTMPNFIPDEYTADL